MKTLIAKRLPSIRLISNTPSVLSRAPSVLPSTLPQPLPAALSLTLAILPCNFKRWAAIQPALDLRGASYGSTTYYIVVCSFPFNLSSYFYCLPLLFSVENALFLLLPYQLLSSP